MERPQIRSHVKPVYAATCVIAGITAAFHLGVGTVFLGLCSAFKTEGHTIQHFAGFPTWYYFTATSYILLSGFFWNVWWLVSSQLNLVESVGQDLSGMSLLSYTPVWVLQLLYILLFVISLTTSLHVIVMNFVLIQLHKKREKRRQLRIRSKGRSGSDIPIVDTELETGQNKFGKASPPRKNNNSKRQRHVLFNVQRTYSLAAISVAIVTPINSIIKMIHQLFFVDIALFCFQCHSLSTQATPLLSKLIFR